MSSSIDYDSAQPLDGARATESTHRRIELQAPADLTYLIANVSRAACEKMDKSFPPEAAPEGKEDKMRKRVEELVDNYIRDTFNSAKDSISINGMDSKELEAELEKAQEGEELEPFDTKLASKIQALSQEIEKQTLDLADLRRRAPQQTAQQFRAAFEKQSENYETRLKANQEARMQAAQATDVSIGNVDRVDEMQNMWQRGHEDLAALNAGLGGTVEKMEKAQRALEAVEDIS